ncbi:MAG: winged helix-turn-helix domain-containing protein [Paludibacteraceae bacterium]|jgi:phage antirepressor YoqD-like protein|nr:winged helix-turn-helix domain-containing protein [Paludibacteraceae bacterium]MBP6436842.1 winged helix-turn-helix domain-containing protein [Paludibacteraceae bacterium]MBP7219256.1 winged helix-turn-helix domain-containing protein [Paludibacteraceae bacterium]MBP8627130.1 winged helix-turn-helix domain-containing protein [Paludibacteraceae bacterium]MBP8781785.1 winged helix-turn-helix domain-containing protein [Paludibacteraceae bacterium]
MKHVVGTNAGVVWGALAEANGTLEFKELKKLTKLKEKDLYLAFGWLLKEGKLVFREEEKDLYISLV